MSGNLEVGGLERRPISLRAARAFVDEHHGHSSSPRGWLYGTSLWTADDQLVGVAIAGRPIARLLQDGFTVEITRCCLAEAGVHRNAASALYGALCRAGTALGYRSAITYTLEDEDATSVRAAGFIEDASVPGAATWDRPSRRHPDRAQRPTGPKVRWRRELWH